MLLSQLSSSNPIHMVGLMALATYQRVTQSVCGWDGSSFPGFVPSDDMVNSECVVGIMSGVCGVGI